VSSAAKKGRFLMKKIFVLIIVIGISTVFINADVYVKQKLYTDGYYYGGVNRPAEDTENEIWIGKKKMASFTKNRMTILDMEKNRAFIINRNAKTYSETPLPLDLSTLVESNLVPRLQATQYTGTIKETGKTKKIGKYECRGYEINTYIIYEGDRVNETDTTLWTTSDVPFDVETYRRLSITQQKLRNYNDAFIDELKKIEGFVIAREALFYPKGFSVKSTAAVVEISQKDPPAGIYSVPAGYTKKEKLSIQDLRNR